MVVNLVEKYGVMPKKCFPETYSSENSLRMNRLLKSKVRRRLRTAHCALCVSMSEPTFLFLRFSKSHYPINPEYFCSSVSTPTP